MADCDPFVGGVALLRLGIVPRLHRGRIDRPAMFVKKLVEKASKKVR